MVRISLMRKIKPTLTIHEFLTTPRTPHIFPGKAITRLSRRNPNLIQPCTGDQFSYSNSTYFSRVFKTHHAFSSPISYEAYILPIFPRRSPIMSVLGTRLFGLMFRKLKGKGIKRRAFVFIESTLSFYCLGIYTILKSWVGSFLS